MHSGPINTQIPSFSSGDSRDRSDQSGLLWNLTCDLCISVDLECLKPHEFDERGMTGFLRKTGLDTRSIK